MTRLLSILSVACLGSTLAACSVSARVPFVGAVGSSGPPASAQPQQIEGERDAAIASNQLGCSQELGADTGGIVENAALIEFGAINGCVTDTDDTDGFLVHVDDDMSLSVKLKLLDEHGAVHVEIYDVDGDKLGFASVGSFETKRVRFDVEAETDVFIRLKAFGHGDAKNGRYKLVVGPDKKLARR